MIDKNEIIRSVEHTIENTDAFLVDVKITPDNIITVEIDSPTGVDIDTCVAITRNIEQEFDRDKEDYELEVGSAGITSPFKVKQQYYKNIGNEVEVLTRDGRKLCGTLTEYSDDTDSFTIEIPTKVKVPGKKKPEIVNQPATFAVADVKSVKYNIKFK